MNKKVKELAEIPLKIYFYARENGLNTKHATDIQKALKALDSKDSSIEYAEVLMPLMDIFDRMVMSEVANIRKCNVSH